MIFTYSRMMKWLQIADNRYFSPETEAGTRRMWRKIKPRTSYQCVGSQCVCVCLWEIYRKQNVRQLAMAISSTCRAFVQEYHSNPHDSSVNAKFTICTTKHRQNQPWWWRRRRQRHCSSPNLLVSHITIVWLLLFCEMLSNAFELALFTLSTTNTLITCISIKIGQTCSLTLFLFAMTLSLFLSLFRWYKTNSTHRHDIIYADHTLYVV